uniref:Phospholipase B1, membrane-associated n=1 Tax=Plectus sambesii TaxID=2011161 RepID=A0A914UN84_9BILA
MTLPGWLLAAQLALAGAIIAPGLQPVDYDIKLPFAEIVHNFQNDARTWKSVNEHVSDWSRRSQKTFEDQGNNLTGVEDFHCAEPKLKRAPAESVHAITPADINVVAAMGDSLTAGMGAGAQSLAEDVLEYRGLSFSIGGDGDLKFMTTIPNILRRFNNKLVGASHRVSPVWYKLFSQFNVAVSGSRAPNMYLQATDLVKRMKETELVDIEKDWKLITIFIGANDLCDYCLQPETYSVANYTSNIKAAIDYLKKHLPRTIVNVVSMLKLNMLKETHSISPGCELMHSQECRCLIEMDDAALRDAIRSYQEEVHKFEELEEYQSDDQFVVTVAPALEQADLPLNAAKEPDLAYLAPDCFHPSQLGHSIMAKQVWNNMFEPFGDKTTEFDNSYPVSISLKCPQPDCPFIRTAMNTLNCSVFQSSSVTAEQRKDFLRKSFGAITPSRAFLMKKQSLTDMPDLGAQRFASSSKIVNQSQESSAANAPLIVLTACLALVAAGFMAFILASRRKRNQNRPIDERTPLLSSSFNQSKVY